MSDNWQPILWSVAALCASIFLTYHLTMRPKRDTRPFPFLDLPRELRDMVYEELMDQNPVYPSAKRTVKPATIFGIFKSQKRSSPQGNWLMLANRQVNGEFMEMLCKKATFTLNIDEQNHAKRQLWPVGEKTLKTLKNAEVRIITTSTMLGASDPRFMGSNWHVQENVSKALNKMDKLEHLKLHIQAIGDPLWNPLWVWFHASQSFKTAEGKQFQQITFSLDSWSPGENHLARNNEGKWEWRCAAGHAVVPDPDRWQTIREFAGTIYSDCRLCKPDEEEVGE